MFLTRFLFLDSEYYPDFLGSFMGLVRIGTTDIDQLMSELSSSMKFPAYFGYNWNALFDCLRDFSWIEEQLIYLVHADIPNVGADDLKTYIQILRDTVDDWADCDEHKFYVIFPSSSEARILDMLQ